MRLILRSFLHRGHHCGYSEDPRPAPAPAPIPRPITNHDAFGMSESQTYGLTRFHRSEIVELANTIGHRMLQYTRSDGMPVIRQILLSLTYYAHATHYVVLAQMYGFKSVGSVSKIVNCFTTALCDIGEEYIRMPNVAEIENSREVLYRY